MSDDLGKKIKQITDILGQESIPDNLKGLLTLFAGSGNSEEPSQKAGDNPVNKEEKHERSALDENIDMARRIKKVMDKINTNNDPRINLLNAIKPFLNNKRQSKLNNCIKLLHMSSLTKFVEDNDKSNY
jgi:hypothetical protein